MTPASLPPAGVVAVFVAGAGRTGPAAWPLLDVIGKAVINEDEDWDF
jgi:hypothetical protein